MTRTNDRRSAIRSRTSAAIAVSAALVVSACSGAESSSDDSIAPTGSTIVEDEADESTTTSTTTTTVATTTTATEEPPVIDTVPEPDDSVADVTTTTEPITDPSIPVDTMFDPDSVDGEIERVVLADNEAYKTCLRDLPNCNVAAATRFGALDYAEGTAEFLNRYNAENRTADQVDTVKVTVLGITIGEAAAEAEVVYCYEDGSRIFVPESGDAPAEVIDEFISSRRQALAINLDGAWRISGSVALERADGLENNLCGR